MQNYSNIQKFLHDFVFSKKFINKSLFEIEKIIYLKDIQIKDQSHIFITGLPRSGTTTLLNFLYLSNQYASLTYKSIPFVFSPNFSKLFNKKNISKKERIHGDGITYDINSPEAFDEVFFNTGDDFIKNELVNYIQLICLSENKSKYLSKNNLNYKRIDSINSMLLNSIFLIPIREPLQHAYSLLNQHLLFSKLQKKDDFIRRYMNYLGHNEFGLNHKPWNNPIHFNDLNNINYWLEQWSLFYQNILDKYKLYNNCHFVIYEELNKPNYVEKILRKIHLKKNKSIKSNYFINSNKKKINIKYDENNYNKANLIYENFINSYLF